MVSQTLLASAAFAFLTGAIYAFVGHRLSRRPIPGPGKLAAAGFIAFWYGLAVSTMLGGTGLQALFGAFDRTSLAFSLIISQVSLLAISVALWGLLYYLVYLYTGRTNAWIPIATFYAAFYLFLQYFIWDAGPIGVHAEKWQVVVDYEKDVQNLPATDPYLLSLIIGLLVPQILASLAYLSLVYRVKSPTQRYRILLVSLSILVWFGSPLIALGADVAQQDTYQVVSRTIGLLAAVVIFLAYYPPGFFRRRFGILSLSEEAKHDEASVQEAQPPGAQLRRSNVAV